MDVKKEIVAIQEEINTIKDPLFIKAIKNMLVYRKKMVQPEWWNTLTEEEKQKF
ncbi:hypothetical protein [Aquimarina muelleri]|uniref:Uncharacterized protein n=1 Tax=Aquimarina muelleri TaxID=279356 RepID=A0A918N415_9FLAO|nr:hypothetical protein [Aquimarina muelleri]MCX2765005.1 hypothetical protein [Aquimarina muelleri]GGX16362.1 hypothetical protein GCM10007384_17390 [Aquimarina muelleri]